MKLAKLYSAPVLHPVFSQLIEYGVPWGVVNDIQEEFKNLEEVYKPQLLSEIARYSLEGFVIGNLDFVFAIPVRLKRFNLEHEKNMKKYKHPPVFCIFVTRFLDLQVIAKT